MKIFTSIWMVIVFAVVLTGIRIDNSDTVKTMRYKTWDHFQYVHPRQEVSDTIIVVDITEEDLKKYGQCRCNTCELQHIVRRPGQDEWY